MVPKAGDVVRFTEEFINRHKKEFVLEEDSGWLERYAGKALFIVKVDEKAVRHDTNVRFHVTETPHVEGNILISLLSGEFSIMDSWPVVFEFADSNINHGEYCNCNGPFVITGFTSSYKVCTQCHKEKRD